MSKITAPDSLTSSTNPQLKIAGPLISEGKDTPIYTSLHEDSTAQIRLEVINHSWLLVFISLLFLAAVGVAIADDWVNTQTTLYIPPFVLPTLKYIEGGLFVSGILFAAIFGIKTFRHVLVKGLQELFEIFHLFGKFFSWVTEQKIYIWIKKLVMSTLASSEN